MKYYIQGCNLAFLTNLSSLLNFLFYGTMQYVVLTIYIQLLKIGLLGVYIYIYIYIYI